MSVKEFHQRNAERWAEAVSSLQLGTNNSNTWYDLPSIMKNLTPFMGDNFGHAHLPTGGGMDYRKVRHSSEHDCLEFVTSPQSSDVCKPKSLTIEVFPERPVESFVLLELQTMTSSEMDEEDYSTYSERVGREELVDLGGGDYYPRYVMDQGYLSHDESGREIPLPDDARLVTRWLRGKILLVAKGSLWNGVPDTYSGLHNKMTATEIRETIERGMGR